MVVARYFLDSKEKAIFERKGDGIIIPNVGDIVDTNVDSLFDPVYAAVVWRQFWQSDSGDQMCDVYLMSDSPFVDDFTSYIDDIGDEQFKRWEQEEKEYAED